MIGNASFSHCGKYRWRLSRSLNHSEKELIFIGLNPSFADSCHNDRTLDRLVGFADLWGYGSITVINLFARISKKPNFLKTFKDPIGFKNDFEINRNISHWASKESCDLWLGWGVNGKLMSRNQIVLSEIKKHSSKKPFVIGLTKDGHPCHPLYMSKEKTLNPFMFF